MHPAHGLLSSEKTILPSSLISFCGYATDLALLGERIPNLSFPVCSHFKPVILNGQICNQLDLASVFKARPNIEAGKENGILLILDTNKERSINVENTENNDKNFSSLNLAERQKDNLEYIQIHIDTLAHFSGYGPGSYGMTALKKMTGTTAFLGLSDKEKNCQLQDFTDCTTKSLLRKGKSDCDGCVPWALQDIDSVVSKVKRNT